MSECRALTNIIGNGVATIVVSKWEGELDKERLTSELKNPSPDVSQDLHPVREAA
jgi:aerobic C4-dicarboxylate transport protein